MDKATKRLLTIGVVLVGAVAFVRRAAAKRGSPSDYQSPPLVPWNEEWDFDPFDETPDPFEEEDLEPEEPEWVPPITIHPMTAKFEIHMSYFEKLVAGQPDIKPVVDRKQHLFGAKGKAKVTVTENSRGYAVKIQWGDSDAPLSNARAKEIIEGLDSKLVGRIYKVVVMRA